MKGIITIVGQGPDAAAIAADRNNKQVILKDYTPFTELFNKLLMMIVRTTAAAASNPK